MTSTSEDPKVPSSGVTELEAIPYANGSSSMHHSVSITSVADISATQRTIDLSKDNQYLATIPAKNVAPLSPFAAQDGGVTNLCSASAGARILFATDEWFAAADNLLRDDDPVFDPLAFCTQGKVMDGWETRRRREAGHDWCIIKLVSRTENVIGIEIDTAHFTGNNVPRISLQLADLTCAQESTLVQALPGSLDRLLHGCVQGTGCTPDEVHQAQLAQQQVQWKELLPVTPLRPGYEPSRMHYFQVNQPTAVGTHLRVNYFPDGGVARIRLWGPANTVQPERVVRPPYIPISTGPICTVVGHTTVTDEASMPSRQPYEFPEVSSNGRSIACSNQHYGTPLNLLQSNLGRDMGDGWETARHPERPSEWTRNDKTGLVDSDLMDFCCLELGTPAVNGVDRVLLDTMHFRGNYPESVQVEGCQWQDSVEVEDQDWFALIPRCRMAPDAEHVFDRSKDQIENATKPVTHIRVSIYPDGGVSRVRIYG